MSTRTFKPEDPEAKPFEELRLQNMKKPEPRPDAAPAPDQKPAKGQKE